VTEPLSGQIMSHPPNRASAVPIAVPHNNLRFEYDLLRGEIREALDRVCLSSAFVLGAEVEAFEREFASFCGVKHCVALNSGTSALHLGLLALGVGPGDEVITTPNSFIAAAEAISYTGAVPVFADIDPRTANLDPARVERAITSKTKAIVPVHLYGRPADMDALRSLAQTHNLKLLEDSAQAHAARYRGRRTGGLGHAAAFSFYPTKNLAASGEAGALTTDDDRIAEFARSARTHGQTGRYAHAFVGFNYRMEGFQGAILRIKLKRLEEWTARRRAIAAEYRRALEGTNIEIPVDDPRDESVYHQFVIYVPDPAATARDLAQRGIETAVHYPLPIHLQPAYAHLGQPPGSFPHAERACQRVLSIPVFPGLTDEQVLHVATSLREIAGN
jgi:dTDP-4-amino-4,6-dideoxygalactose transaminase